jgi:ribulose-5-phosphate 4-epimerase/fuculose-1-phosphate aldolase
MTENDLRERLAMHGEALYRRGLAPGSSGNMSIRLEDGLLVTPTNSCMGRLDPAVISKLSWEGRHLDGEEPSKEAFLHLAMYQERPDERAIVHLHSSHSVVVSCMADIDPADVLPPITAYYVMRIGRLPLLPYYRPGDPALAEAVREAAKGHHAMLLANHGPVVAGKSLDAAVYNAEELEETAKLFLILRGCSTRWLDEEQVAALREAFPD